MLNPKKSWGRKPRSHTMKVEASEKDIQKGVDDYLQLKRIDYIRIPDGVFAWIHYNATKSFQKWFNGTFGGRPDNTILYHLTGPYGLYMALELKTQDSKGRAVGKLHGKQKHHADDWKICYSIDEAIEAINEFEKMAEKVKNMLTSYGNIGILNEEENKEYIREVEEE